MPAASRLDRYRAKFTQQQHERYDAILAAYTEWFGRMTDEAREAIAVAVANQDHPRFDAMAKLLGPER